MQISVHYKFLTNAVIIIPTVKIEGEGIKPDFH